MNPEIEFRKKPGDYGQMEVNVYEYAVMQDLYGEEHTYLMDVINAPEASDAQKPAVIFVHGGAFIEPCDRRQGYIARFAKVLTGHGFSVVSPDYPIYKDEQDRDRATVNESADCCRVPAEALIKAADFIRANHEKFGINPERMAIMGGSAGSMAAFYAASAEPGYFKRFINLWGVPAELPDFSGFPPVLSIHGTSDCVVSYSREHGLSEALARAGIPSRLISLDGSGHTPIGRMDEYMPEILDFLSVLL